ncbi:type III pantothenate kinase [Cellvibrio sp. pealriver]|uniref:type III pantothenate kinase n=1 Tax=Cellvibrio sp. pealriver TaxID=1622269 RepID=UPI00066FEA14|nr:type III pantothenate kinase [Cellvibrio sp. pealriver]
MFLDIDMGNTRTKWRLRNDSVIVDRGIVNTGFGFKALEGCLGPYKSQVKVVWVVSVVGGKLDAELTEWINGFFSVLPQFAQSCEQVGVVKNGYEVPAGLGVDRWLGLLAGYHLVGGACVIVSCGTAMTVDLLSGDGSHQGGYIAPGLASIFGSINSSLRLIQIDKERFSMGLLPGKGTDSAVFAGVSSMVTGVVENGIRQLSGLGENNIQLVLTGGDADSLALFYPQALLIPDLILDGLVYVMGRMSPME